MKRGPDAASIGSFAAEQGDKLLRSVTAQISRTIKSPGVDEVHDLRVAIRRFRRMLAVLKPCYPRGESRRIRRGLQQIMVQAGSVRDYDIAMRSLSKMAVPESGALAEDLRKRRETDASTLTASLERWVRRNLPARWRAARTAETTPSSRADARFRAAPVAATVKQLLRDMAKEHFRRGKDAVHTHASVEKLHKFRIAARNLRYMLDALAEFNGASLPGITDQLKELQDLMGDIHDCAVVRRMLRQKKGATRKESNEAARKEFLSALKKRQRKKTEEFRQQYAGEVSSAATFRKWKASLESVGAPGSVRPKLVRRKLTA